MCTIGVIKTKRHAITQDFNVSKHALGVGLSGNVLKCTRKSDNLEFALKILKDTPKARREIELHSKAAQNFDHIVQIEDVYENMYGKDKCLLMVMECMSGGELFSRIQAKGDKPFTEREAAGIMKQICVAVDHLHSINIAHRDLKPENLLYANKSDDSLLKLTDFGFAREVLSSKSLQTPCYTPYYAAPEVLSYEKYDKSCDLWSIGVIMYILYHGAVISPGMKKRIRAGQYTFPEQEWQDISFAAKDLICRLLKPLPEERISIKELKASPWISQSDFVPETPLPTVSVLREEDNWHEIAAEFNEALKTMRPETESMNMKSIHLANNKILERRRKKCAEQA